MTSKFMPPISEIEPLTQDEKFWVAESATTDLLEGQGERFPLALARALIALAEEFGSVLGAIRGHGTDADRLAFAESIMRAAEAEMAKGFEFYSRNRAQSRANQNGEMDRLDYELKRMAPLEGEPSPFSAPNVTPFRRIERDENGDELPF